MLRVKDHQEDNLTEKWNLDGDGHGYGNDEMVTLRVRLKATRCWNLEWNVVGGVFKGESGYVLEEPKMRFKYVSGQRQESIPVVLVKGRRRESEK